eukprot:3981733-Prymnesium_polylepis.1
MDKTEDKNRESRKCIDGRHWNPPLTMPPSVFYGRLLFAQATTHCLYRAYGRPVVAPGGGAGVTSCRSRVADGRWYSGYSCSTSDDDSGHASAPVLVEHE